MCLLVCVLKGYDWCSCTVDSWGNYNLYSYEVYCYAALPTVSRKFVNLPWIRWLLGNVWWWNAYLTQCRLGFEVNVDAAFWDSRNFNNQKFQKIHPGLGVNLSININHILGKDERDDCWQNRPHVLASHLSWTKWWQLGYLLQLPLPSRPHHPVNKTVHSVKLKLLSFSLNTHNGSLNCVEN